LEHNVERVVLVSSDKAVEPINLYGATKLCGEKMMEAANNYRGKHRTEFKYVRYGNVFGSRGSVLDVWNKQRPILVRGKATRFHLMMKEAVELVEEALKSGRFNCGFILKNLPSYDIQDLADAFCNVTGKSQEATRQHPDEKIHEKLDSELSSADARRLKVKELQVLVKDYLKN